MNKNWPNDPKFGFNVPKNCGKGDWPKTNLVDKLEEEFKGAFEPKEAFDVHDW
jgi:hypothetical protein